MVRVAVITIFMVSGFFTFNQTMAKVFKPVVIAPNTTIEGYSVQKRPIKLYKFGNGPSKVLFLGAFHGNEYQSRDVLIYFMEYLSNHQELLESKTVYFVPVVNPDGYTVRKRTNAHGVDINRNFPTADWRKTYTRKRFKSGTRKPEPETKTVMSILSRYNPSVIVTLHTPHNCNNYDGPAGDLAFEMTRRNHYPVRKNMGYSIRGSFGTYAGKEREIPVITLELSKSHSEVAWTQNKDALLAAISYTSDKGYENEMPLFLTACKTGDSNAAAYLIKKGGVINQKDAVGWTGLFYSVYNKDLATTRIMLENGASADQSDNYGWTPLMIASQSGDYATLSLLLEYGAAVNKKDAYGNSSILFAGRNGNRDCAQALLDKGANINDSDNEGKTAILDTVRNGYFATLRLLIEKGADVNEKDVAGRTPLLEASYYGFPKIVQYLITNGANINAKDNNGNTAYTLAREEGNKKIARLLKKAKLKKIKNA